jgi:hypothetical protein
VTRASGFDTFAATPSSANLAGLVSDETGTGALVFANSPTLVTPALGTPASGVVTNLTGTASININGTVGATTPASGAFTTLSASGAISGTTGTFSGILTASSARVAIGTFTVSDTDTFLTLYPHTNTGSIYHISNDSTGEFKVSRGSIGNEYAAVDLLVTSTGINSTAIGATTPSTGAFTTLGATGAVTFDGISFADGTAANTLVTTSGGNVGIGTSAPANKIDVSKSVSGNNNHGITITNTNTAGWGGSLQFAHTLSGSTAVATRSFISSEGGPTGSIFRIATCIGDNPAAERMRIDSAGNVGIGTTSPLAQLDVVDRTGNNNRAIVVSRSDTDAASKSTAINIRHWLNAEEPVCLIGAAIEDNTSNDIRIGGGFSNLNSATSIAFRTAANNATTNGTERMRITSAGNVGIGTATPGSKLDVDGELRIGNTVNTVSPTSPDRTITMVIGGTTYYIHAKTTND